MPKWGYKANANYMEGVFMRKRNTMVARIFAASMATAMIFSSVTMEGMNPVAVQAAEINLENQSVSQQPSENLVLNGDFSEGDKCWGMNAGAAVFNFENGKVTLSVPENTGLGADWMPGLYQDGIVLEEGFNYQVSFDVMATIDREITVGFDNGRVFMHDVALTAGESQHVSYETGVIDAAGASANQKLYFYMGMFHGETNYTDDHMVEITNVKVQKVVTEEPQSPEEIPQEPDTPKNLLNGTVYTTKSEMTTNSVDQCQNAHNWALYWSDEFGTEEFSDGKLVAHSTDGAGSALEGAAWSYMIGNGSGYSGSGWGNAELEYYTDNNADVTVGDDIDGGALVITAEKDSSYAGSSFTSARLWTMDDGNLTKEKEALFTKQYGRFESRIKVVPREGEDATGLWPAFWMMPAYDEYGTWAASGEIDIMEARGSNQHVVDGTIHYGSQWPNNKAIGGHYGNDEFSTADWHTYAVEWMPGELRWYVDDVCYYTTSEWYSTADGNAADFTYPAPFNQEFYILLNLAVGGNYDAGALSDNLTGASMYVDYVRVYDLVGENGTLYTQEDYEELEKEVSAPTYVPVDTPVAGEVGISYVDASDLVNYHQTGNYPSEESGVRNAQWFVSNLSSGSGTSVNSLSKDGGDDVLCVDVTKTGTNDYEVQLIHNVPLTRGYRYEVSFDVRADKTKSIPAKFANISGYPAYSDSFSVEAESEWKHYTYSFDMVADTDADGRLEFTLGGTLGKTYFKNFSIVCVGQTPVLGEDDAKEPLSNGNHVYNGTFDQGTARIYYWHAFDNTILTSPKATCQAVVEGTNAVSGIYQQGINLLCSDTYQVNFGVSAESDKEVTVRLQSADGTNVYGEKNFAVSNAWSEQSFTFTMPADVTDTNAVLVIQTGNGKVVVDNVSMYRLTNNNLDWSSVDFYPLYNGDFYNGDDGWNIWSENAGWQQHSINGTGAMDMEYSVQEGADFWCVGVQSSAVALTEGVPYQIVIDYESTKDVNLKVETPDGVQTDYDFAQGAHEKVITMTPVKDLSGKISMYFGNRASGGNQHFIIKSVTVKVDEEKAAVPEEYRVKKPGSIASAGAVRAGSASVIRMNDTEWANAITHIYVNGKAYGADVVTVADGSIIIDASLMPEEGSYTVKFDALGYAQTKAITQTVLEASGNVLVNGKFDSNIDGWETYFSSWNIPNGSAEAVDGEAVIHVVSTEGNNWDCQFKQSGLELSAADYYMLSFDAYATVERPIQMEFANLGTASQTIVNLTTEKKTYRIYFTDVKETEAASILFMTGNVNGCLGDFPAVGSHDVILDNVALYKAEKSDIEAAFAPKIELAEQAFLGNDIILSYTENSVWEQSDIRVFIGGKEVPEQYVNVDDDKNQITIAGRMIGESGDYAVSLLAEGYDAVGVTVKVLADAKTSLLPDAWFTWLDDAEKGSLTTSADALECDFVETVVSEWNTPEFWSIQAKKENVTTIADTTYILSFDINLEYVEAGVEAARGVVIETSLGQQTISVTPGESHFELEYTPGARSDFYVLLMLGGAETDFSTAAHHISVTDIVFYEKREGAGTQKEKLKTPAQLTATSEKTGEVTVSWNAVDKAGSYGIYLADEADGTYIFVAETTELSYTLTEMEAGVCYVAVAAMPEDEVAYMPSDLVKVSVEVTSQTPDEGEKPDEGQKPDEGEKPDEGDKPDEGEKPSEGDKPEVGETPDVDDKPDVDDNTPDEGDVSDADHTSSTDNTSPTNSTQSTDNKTYIGNTVGENNPSVVDSMLAINNVSPVKRTQTVDAFSVVENLTEERDSKADTVDEENASDAEKEENAEKGSVRKLVNGDTEVVAADGVLPAGSSIKTEQISAGEIWDAATKAVQNYVECKNYVVYKIDLTDGAGVSLHQLDGFVTVTMLLPAELTVDEKNTVVVYRLEEDGSLTKCDTVVADGRVSFATDHFSTYIFAEQEIEESQSTAWGVTIVVLVVVLGVAVYFFIWRRRNGIAR